MNKRYALLLLLFLFAACGTKKPTQSASKYILKATSKVQVTAEVVDKYINSYKTIAQSNMKKYGIPASIILAQAILESGAGTGSLSVQANNHFGIKCHKDWKGAFVKHDDDVLAECFRKYKKPEESFADHAVFLKGRERYASLFELEVTDYKAWANGLRAAGYATDTQYPTKLIDIIERHKLYKYDLSGRGPISSKQTTNPEILGSGNHLVKKGDTLYSISKKYNVSVDQLVKINGITNSAISIGQVLIVK